MVILARACMLWHLWGHPPSLTSVVCIPLFTETPLFLSNTWWKQVVLRLNLFLHYNKTYLLSNGILVKVDFLGLYKVRPVIAVPFKAFLAVHCLKLSKGIHQFCWKEVIITFHLRPSWVFRKDRSHMALNEVSREDV